MQTSPTNYFYCNFVSNILGQRNPSRTLVSISGILLWRLMEYLMTYIQLLGGSIFLFFSFFIGHEYLLMFVSALSSSTCALHDRSIFFVTLIKFYWMTDETIMFLFYIPFVFRLLYGACFSPKYGTHVLSWWFPSYLRYLISSLLIA